MGRLAAVALAAVAAAGACSSRGARGTAQNAAQIQEAIARGLGFLRGDPSDLSALVVLDYLQRRYALAADLAFARTHRPDAGAARLQVWGRFVGDDRLTDEAPLGLLTEAAGIEEVVMHALYCDRFPPPPWYLDFLARFAGRGDYELTHAALALKLLRDHGCLTDGRTPLDLDERLRRGARDLIARVPPDPRYEELDVRYEALAVLQDFLGAREVADAEIGRLLAEQQADGGWRPEPDQPSRPHPTVLAIWALLAHSRPDAPPIPFDRR